MTKEELMMRLEHALGTERSIIPKELVEAALKNLSLPKR